MKSQVLHAVWCNISRWVCRRNLELITLGSERVTWVYELSDNTSLPGHGGQILRALIKSCFAQLNWKTEWPEMTAQWFEIECRGLLVFCLSISPGGFKFVWHPELTKTQPQQCLNSPYNRLPILWTIITWKWKWKLTSSPTSTAIETTFPGIGDFRKGVTSSWKVNIAKIDGCSESSIEDAQNNNDDDDSDNSDKRKTRTWGVSEETNKCARKPRLRFQYGVSGCTKWRIQVKDTTKRTFLPPVSPACTS